MDTGQPTERGNLPPIDSRSDFEAAVRWTIESVRHSGARRMTWLDSDFTIWPLEDLQVLQTLTEWLRLPQRHLVLLARDYEQMPRAHPRFVRWRRDWAHAVEAYSPSQGIEVQLPTLLVDDGRLSLHLIDAVRWRGRVSLEAPAAQLWRQEIDALLQRCEPAFAVHHLGL